MLSSILLSLATLQIAAVEQLPDWAQVRAVIAPEPSFYAAERAVDNWRWQSARYLDLDLEKAAALGLGRDIQGLSRCVRLNNYWCVKKAGWTGEIAADSEGHVAFASAREGAMAAAALLKRYYTIYNLKSAHQIVSRWAPPSCGFAAAPRARVAGRGMMGARSMLGPEPKGLTTRGLGSTLRARYLASRGRGLRPRAARQRLARSVVADSAPKMMATPSIVSGFAESAPAPVKLAPMSAATLNLGPAPGGKLPPLVTCGGDAGRIANYAANLAANVAAGPDADLKLFDAAGVPAPALATVLVNMAAVEIGPLKARRALVEMALATLYPGVNFSEPAKSP
jgi:hypothetical protein